MTKNIIRLYKGFWQIADPKIWVGSVVPFIVGTALSYTFGNVEFKLIDLFWFFSAFAALGLIETGKNAVNEYFDYLSGVDPGVDNEHRTPFSGGKKTIVDGVLSITECAIIAVLTLGAAVLIGLAIAYFKEFNVIYIGILGVLLSIIYTLPPFKLSYRGFGELAVGITFGPLITLGAYILFTGRFDILPLLVSIPIAFLIANVLWINEYPDYETDKFYGKKNLVVRFGKEKSLYIYVALFTLAYLSDIIIAIYTLNPVWLITLLTIPLAIKAINNCKANMNDITKLILSNALTIQIYMLNGVLLVISALIDKFI